MFVCLSSIQRGNIVLNQKPSYPPEWTKESDLNNDEMVIIYGDGYLSHFVNLKQLLKIKYYSKLEDQLFHWKTGHCSFTYFLFFFLF